MGKKKTAKRGEHASDHPVCGGCCNFKPRKGDKGTCARKDKPRSADDKACGHHDPR